MTQHVPCSARHSFRRIGLTASCLSLAMSLGMSACSGDDDASGDAGTSAVDDTAGDDGGDATPLTAEEAGPVVDNYAELVFANYSDAITTGEALQTALAAFVADPSAATQDAAKDAWFAARQPYGQTEGFRFYDGPIDNIDGPEGQLNAWPMDESYVDYVDGMPESGIINDTGADISKAGLAGLNEVGGEENVATGYHAIEFLLWGQDLNTDGPGDRSFEDFLDDGAQPNADRRRQYLEVVSELLLDDLNGVAAQWDGSGSGNYRSTFVALPPEEAIQNMMRGIGALAGAELAEERMNVAFDTKLQEDEHSCFSDNTHNDILYNFLSVKNVYLGDYGSVSGPGIDTLVEARNPELATQIADKLAATEALINDIPAPFDQAILGADTDPGRVAVAAAVTSLRELGDMFVVAAASMDITLNVTVE